MYNQLIIEKYKAKRFIIMYLAAVVLAAAGFFLGFLNPPENLDTATVFSFSICDTSFMFIISLVTAWFAAAVIVISLTATQLVFRKAEIK